MRTIYLGTSAFAAAVLRALASSPHRPQLVVTRPDRPRGRGRRLASPPVADAARELGIELYQPESVNNGDARGRIAAAAPEVVCVCAFGALIQEPLLSQYELLNVHPSLLPRWRGAAPIERAIMAGDEHTGVSIMRLTAGLDSGPVCSQAQEPITSTDTYGTLAQRLQTLAGALLIDALDRRPECAEQDDGQGHLCREADTRRSAARRQPLRARAGAPGARAEPARRRGRRPCGRGSTRGLGGAHRQRTGAGPGELSLEGPLPVLGCAGGALELVVVQPPGRRAMGGADYLRGLRG